MNALYTKRSTRTFAEVGARLEKAAASRQFGVLGTVDIAEKMSAKGVAFVGGCRIYEVCNPAQAKIVLDLNRSVSTVLPCRISIYEESGSVSVSTLLPGAMIAMFGTPSLGAVAAEVEAVLKGIVDEAAD